MAVVYSEVKYVYYVYRNPDDEEPTYKVVQGEDDVKGTVYFDGEAVGKWRGDLDDPSNVDALIATYDPIVL